MTLQIYPAIDLMDGKAVRLEQGRAESATVYSDTPWDLVARYADAGAARLHVVDLDAAFSGGSKHNRPVIDKIVRTLGDKGLEVEVGGGIRTEADCDALFDMGVRYAVLGTMAIKRPDLAKALCRQHPGQMVVAVDALEGLVAVEGWQESTAVRAVDLGKDLADAGAAALLYTDIGRDGMRTGPNLAATGDLARTLAPCPVIASGGVSQLSDLDGVKESGAAAVIIGKALYENVFTVEQAVAHAKGLSA